MKIKVFNGNQPVFETKYDEQQKANFGLHRDRCPDRDWGQFRWGRMDNMANTGLSEVELTPELAKILIEDICEHYNGEQSYIKLMDFGLIEQYPDAVTKEIAIQRFREACADPRNSDMRKNAIEHQYNRNTWDIFDWAHFVRPLLIRLERNNDPMKLGVLTPGRIYNFDLSLKEYEDLEKLYFGEFKPDYDYLKKLGVTFTGE